MLKLLNITCHNHYLYNKLTNLKVIDYTKVYIYSAIIFKKDHG